MVLPQGIFFDLDGTLVHSSLDFAAMKKEIACPPEYDILSYVGQHSLQKQKEFQKVIHQHELQDAQNTYAIDGAIDALLELKNLGVKTGILTRNSAIATRIKLEVTQLNVDYILTREDAPPKPSPAGLLQLAEYFGLACHHCAFVGDYRYDLEAAKAAGMTAVLYQPMVKPSATRTKKLQDFSALADLQFEDFAHFVTQLSSYWEQANSRS